VDELALIQAAKASEPGAGAFLVSRYGHQLIGYCRTLAPEMSDVDREMICEQAVELAVRKIEEYDEQRGSFSGWLRGFVRNTVLNWRRLHGLRHPDSADELSLEQPTTPPAAPVALPPEVTTAVGALPELDQLHLYLRHVEHLPTKAIATLLDKSDAAVRKCLSRIHAHLREQLDN